MNKKKIIYISLLILTVLLVTSIYVSYGFFTNKLEEHGKLNLVVGTLDYQIESKELINNQIAVPAGKVMEFVIKVKSLNEIDSNYELYYLLKKENPNVEVGYSVSTKDSPKGMIRKEETKEITVIIENTSNQNAVVEFKVIGGFIQNELVLAEGYSLPFLPRYKYVYTGGYQEFVVPKDGTYQIELWGASGGNASSDSGKGGYVSGQIYLSKGTSLYVYVGEAGQNGIFGDDITLQNGRGGLATFNGGGAGGTAGGGLLEFVKPYSGYLGGPSGGGATDIRLVAGDWDFFDSLKSRIMVAGGGGGFHNNLQIGAGEPNIIMGGNNLGLVGEDGSTLVFEKYTNKRGIGGTQTTGYDFGIGGTGSDTGISYACHGHGGGGGGYYGGTGGLDTDSNCYIIGGGAGSSFISGYDGCNAISEDSTEEQIIHTDQPNHYSGYIFTNANMIAGTSSMPTYEGNSSMIGNIGNGYAKITFIDSK